MPTITRSWHLEINGVPLATPAWEIPDLSPILDDPALRGANRIIPGTSGVLAYPRRITETILTFPLDVVGDVDQDGNAMPDPFEGLNLNMAYLKANLGLAESLGDGTVPATFRRGTLFPLMADVQFLGFKGTTTRGDRMLRTTFDILIPAGQFEGSGS